MAQQESQRETRGMISPMLLKCAKCFNLLQNPVQLPACYHILCRNCLEQVGTGVSHSITCPQCGKVNANPITLQRIAGVDGSRGQDLPCDNCGYDKKAIWNCVFPCGGKNLCGSCLGEHSAEKHRLLLIAQSADVAEHIFDRGDGQNTSSQVPHELETDGASPRRNSGIQCPICTGASCDHIDRLMTLRTIPDESIAHCKVQGHVDCEGNALELKYFCMACWIPVCGDCSEKGEHKLHNTKDISTLAKFLPKFLKEHLERVEMLLEVCNQDVKEEEGIEDRLRQHVENIETEMDNRKVEILEQTTNAFSKAVMDAQLQGRNILQEYREQLETVICYRNFLQKVNQAVEEISVDPSRFNVLQYVSAFMNHELADKLISELDNALEKVVKPAERRLVLPEVKNLHIPPPPLARVGTEWTNLKLAFSFSLHEEISLVHSIVVSNSKECLLSCRRGLGDKYDTILNCHYVGDKGNPVRFAEYDVVRGRYFISLLSSGEIAASYTASSSGFVKKKSHAVQYSDGVEIESSHSNRVLNFKDIKEVSFEPFGIATTKDNYIILCVNADVKKGISYVMLMTLQGKVLKETVKLPGPNMISPNYVAVSDSGDICVTDTEGSSVIVLDKDLEIQERMNFRLPTSFSDLKIKGSEERQGAVFQPHGVCFDPFGRIIIADPANHCVVRMVRNPETQGYKMEPLVSRRDDLPRFSSPKLVAMGPDSRLWVVCREAVFVFNYCT